MNRLSHRFRVTQFLILTSILTCCGQIQLQTDHFRQHLRFLASPELEGRFPGTRGDSMAANYIKTVFEEIGLRPLYDNYFQAFEFVAGTQVSDSSFLVLGSDTLTLIKDFVSAPFSSSARIKASFFDVNLDSITGRKLSSLKKTSWLVINIQGRDPGTKEILNMSFIADSLNAAGVILVIPFDSLKTVSFNQRPLIFPGSFQVTIPVVFVDKKSWQNSMDKQRLARKGIDSIEANIRLHKLKIRTQNVVGYIPGNADTTKYIVIGSHYDHLGYGGRNSTSRTPHLHKIHPGADDNASGTVMIMNLAKTLSQSKPPISLIFVAFGAEEAGLIGARNFVSSPPVTLNNILAMLNFDMVGRMENNTVYIGGVGTSPLFQSIIDTLKTSISVVTSQSGSGPSDHSAFYNSKIPVLYFNTGIHTDYHTPDDTYDKINFEGMEQLLTYTHNLMKALFAGYEQITFTATSTGDLERSGSRASLKVTLGILPDITGGDNTGLKVMSVNPGGLAASLTIEKGDKIININGMPIKNIYDYMDALQTLERGKVIHITILRDNQEKVFLLQL